MTTKRFRALDKRHYHGFFILSTHMLFKRLSFLNVTTITTTTTIPNTKKNSVQQQQRKQKKTVHTSHNVALSLSPYAKKQIKYERKLLKRQTIQRIIYCATYNFLRACMAWNNIYFQLFLPNFRIRYVSSHQLHIIYIQNNDNVQHRTKKNDVTLLPSLVIVFVGVAVMYRMCFCMCVNNVIVCCSSDIFFNLIDIEISIFACVS